jgi:hypothetical protein
MLLVGAFLYNKHKDSSEDAAYQNLQTVTITDEGNNAQKMLLVTFEIGNAADSIKLKSIDQYNSHADVPDVRENQYNLSVTEEGSPVYLTYFDIPLTALIGSKKRTSAHYTLAVIFRKAIYQLCL